MISSFTLRTDELNASVIETIKKLFADREIEIIVQDAQTDTDYLLESPEKKTPAAVHLKSGERTEAPHPLGVRPVNSIFSEESFVDYHTWATEDRKLFRKINELIKDILRSPFSGIGKPEPLKHELSGYWSRRIDGEHRLVYKVAENSDLIASCKYHY